MARSRRILNEQIPSDERSEMSEAGSKTASMNVYSPTGFKQNNIPEMFRTLIRIVSLNESGVKILVPGWDSRQEVTIPREVFPLALRSKISTNARFFAWVALGADSADELAQSVSNIQEAATIDTRDSISILYNAIMEKENQIAAMEAQIAGLQAEIEALGMAARILEGNIICQAAVGPSAASVHSAISGTARSGEKRFWP